MTRPRIARAEALAKINRELRVGPRRSDGYHEIRSRLVTIDLSDTIEAEEASEFSLACEPPEVPADRSNLVAKAALALAERLGVEPRARLLLQKRIPVGAGLGGASADAAVTLRLLSRLWRLPVADADLAAVAASLGSDVPFFLFGGECDVGGRGERVAPRDSGPPEELTLLVPPFSMSTPEVYAAFDRLGGAATPPERLEIAESGRFLGPNDLERAVVAVRPEMADYLALGRRIARECGVTGSGSTIVLVGARTDALAEFLTAHAGARALQSRTIGREEYVRRTAFSGDATPRA